MYLRRQDEETVVDVERDLPVLTTPPRFKGTTSGPARSAEDTGAGTRQ
jgi:hypothetical protein